MSYYLFCQRLNFVINLCLLLSTINGRTLQQRGKNQQNGLIDPVCLDEVNLVPEAARIAGGQQVGSINRWPYIVALQMPFDNDFGFVHRCAGVLIAPTLVLTAAQCVWIDGGIDYRFQSRFAEGPIQGELVAAVQPLCRHQKGILRIPITRYYMFPEYMGNPVTTGNHDVAVLVLQAPVPTNIPFIDYHKVVDLDLDFVALAVTMGWGGTTVQEYRDPELFANSAIPLQIAGLSLYKSSRCQQGISSNISSEVQIDKNQVLCAFNQNVKPCFGDSGGPLILADGAASLQVSEGNPSNDILLGILSWGLDFSCSSAADFPTVFANMEAYVDWLDSIVNTEAASQQQTSDDPTAVIPLVTTQSGPVAAIISPSTPAPTPIADMLKLDKCERPQSLQCDRDALLQFRVSRPVLPSYLLSWSGQNPCEGWFGITCGQVGKGNWRVTGISIQGHNQQPTGGSLPLEFSLLRYLQVIDLPELGITGTLPPQISVLNRLSKIRFSFNTISGSLPPQLSSFTQLEYLSLPQNLLTGNIPVEFSVLKRLSFLSLTGNQLTGTLPVQFSKLKNIQEVLLGDNFLTGIIPQKWSRWQKLEKLWLNGNQGLCGKSPEFVTVLAARSIANLGKQVVTTDTNVGSKC